MDQERDQGCRRRGGADHATAPAAGERRPNTTPVDWNMVAGLAAAVLGLLLVATKSEAQTAIADSGPLDWHVRWVQPLPSPETFHEVGIWDFSSREWSTFLAEGVEVEGCYRDDLFDLLVADLGQVAALVRVRAVDAVTGEASDWTRAVPVSEPSSALLMSMGLAGLFWVGRRRQPVTLNADCVQRLVDRTVRLEDCDPYWQKPDDDDDPDLVQALDEHDQRRFLRGARNGVLGGLVLWGAVALVVVLVLTGEASASTIMPNTTLAAAGGDTVNLPRVEPSEPSVLTAPAEASPARLPLCDRRHLALDCPRRTAHGWTAKRCGGQAGCVIGS